MPRRPSEGPSPWKAVDVHSARATCSNGVPTAATKPFAYVVETGKTFVPTSFAFNGAVLAAKQGPLPQDQVTCTETLPDGTLAVTGFFVPPTG